MDKFVSFFQTHATGLLMIFVCIALTCVFLQWLAYIFKWGRYNVKASESYSWTHILADLLVKIINDFRHLLALIIMLIFLFVLTYCLLRAGKDIKDITSALQAVVSTLGGIIGSIIGYYFGESAGKKTAVKNIEPPESELTQQDNVVEEIRPVQPPSNNKGE